MFEGKIFESLEDLDVYLVAHAQAPILGENEHWESIDSTFDDDDELSYREDKPEP